MSGEGWAYGCRVLPDGQEPPDMDNHQKIGVVMGALLPYGVDIRIPEIGSGPDGGRGMYWKEWGVKPPMIAKGDLISSEVFGWVGPLHGQVQLTVSIGKPSAEKEKLAGLAGGNSGYCATKGAVELITRSLALEWAPYGIRVNAIGPALIITPAIRPLLENPERAKTYASKIPMGRIALPEDLVGACVYLASNAAGFVTGQTIYVDGGLTAL